MSKRDDDSPESTKKLLAQRTGYRCSMPDCDRQTSGPHSDGSKSVNTGDAAHITAASPRFARFDQSMTPEQRRSPDNGIWFCAGCHRLIDRDEGRYTAQQLRNFKFDAEKRALERQANSEKLDDAEIALIDHQGGIIAGNSFATEKRSAIYGRGGGNLSIIGNYFGPPTSKQTN